MTGPKSDRAPTALRDLRRAHGLSVERLAGLCGLSAKTISRIEAGRVNPHSSTLRVLADALECEVALLQHHPIPRPSAPGRKA
jgi:transcriptional regulator with XRE-family HTH domain